MAEALMSQMSYSSRNNSNRSGPLMEAFAWFQLQILTSLLFRSWQTKKGIAAQRGPRSFHSCSARQQCLRASLALFGSYEAPLGRGVLAPGESHLPCACSLKSLRPPCSFRSRAHGNVGAMKQNSHYDPTLLELWSTKENLEWTEIARVKWKFS